MTINDYKGLVMLIFMVDKKTKFVYFFQALGLGQQAVDFIFDCKGGGLYIFELCNILIVY